MFRQLGFVLLLVVSGLPAQINRTLESSDPVFNVVSYVDVIPASRTAGINTLKQYREASRKDAGYVGMDVFEQIGRTAHFLVLEKWSDEKSFNAHAAGENAKQLSDKLAPIRLGFDQRTYRSFAVVPASAALDDRQILVISHVDTAGTQVDAPTLLRQLAETSRKEEGNVRFDVVQLALRPNHFTMIEVWQTQKALDAHTVAAHTRKFRDTIQPVLGSPLDERSFKVVDLGR